MWESDETESSRSEHQPLSNYPNNPFNPDTTIRFGLASPSEVRLTVYNGLGQRVRPLIDEEQPAGGDEQNWDGRDDSGQDVASGVYLCRLEVAGNGHEGPTSARGLHQGDTVGQLAKLYGPATRQIAGRQGSYQVYDDADIMFRTTGDVVSGWTVRSPRLTETGLVFTSALQLTSYACTGGALGSSIMAP